MEVRDADGKVTTKASLLWARYRLEQVAVEDFLKASEGFMVILDGWKNPAHDHVGNIAICDGVGRCCFIRSEHYDMQSQGAH
eukprot:474915-Rhodomonas_salina.1